MATQRRSWLARVGVILAVSLGALVGVTTPAFAAPSLFGAGLSPNTIKVGEESTFKFKIRDTAKPTGDTVNVQVQVTGSGSCSGNNCGTFPVELKAPNGESNEQSVKIRGDSAGQAQVRVQVDGQTLNGSYNLAIQAAQPVQEYTGTLNGVVNNITLGKPVQGAKVTLQDGNQKSFTATTSAAGTYQFNGAQLKIAPGVLVITVTRDPLVLVGDAKSMSVSAGQTATLPALEMQDPTAPTASANPGPTATADASGGPVASNGAIENKSDGGGLDSMTWIMIIVGGLLVALGIGAIVLLLVRRNNDEEEEEDDEQPARGRPGGPRGPQQPGYRPPPQPTQQYGGPGYGGRPADPTIVARPGMNDAPTMMHRPAADPYGAQPTQQYGAPGWAPQQPGYGPQSGPGYGQASGGGGYGSQASGGGAYGGGQASGGGAYGQAGGGQASGGGAYGQASGGGGYGQQPGYGQGGYGQQPGYGAGQYDEPTAYAGGSGAAGAGGYDQPGYNNQGQPGYDPQQPGYGQGGYGQSDPYGGQQGYQQDPYGQQGHSDDRRNRGDRRLDWLDD